MTFHVPAFARVEVAPPASLGDLVWNDANANGIQDSGETGIAGIGVDLLKSGAPQDTATTDSAGHYTFAGLTPGSYSLKFNLPAGYVFSAPIQGTDRAADSDADESLGRTAEIQLRSGQADDTVDAGMHKPASIGDLLWKDVNANGIQDSGEPGMPGVLVKLFKSGASVGATATDYHCSYSFAGLAPGVYRLKFSLPEGYAFSIPGQGADTAKDSDVDMSTGMTASVVLTSGQSDMTRDAGIYQNASLGDFVWEDINGNGIQDESEPGIGQAEVRLYTSSGALVGSNATDSTGHYAFTGLSPGDYYLDFARPDGYSFTTSRKNVDRATDSNAGADGKTDNLTLTSGQNDTTWDAGLYRNASLGGFVWDDLNTNGIQDQGEPGISGVLEDLYRFDLNTGTYSKVPSNATGQNGSYSFTSLVPGKYYVIFGKPADYVFSPASQGTDTTIDSDVCVITGQTGDIQLDSGQTNDTVDAGIYRLASIGDLVWNDANANGIQDSGEPGVPGVQVELFKSGASLESTATDCNGSYNFTGLTPGSYSLKFNLPSGYIFSPPEQGTDIGRDSNADVGTGKTSSTDLDSGQSDMTWDAGIYQNASLGDFVWEDINGNGIQDESEPGIGYAEVKLFTPSGALVGSNATDSTGHYAFTDLSPGDYYLNFTRPEGYLFTINHQNIDRAKDSDAGADGKTDNLTLTSGQNDTTWDAGLYRNASLGDFAWDDLNINGIQDQGEPGISGIVADLYRFDLNAGNYSKVLSNSTGPNGSYDFTSLIPGKYHVIFEKPAGHIFSPANQGTDSARDSNADVSTGQTCNVQLYSGQRDDTVDAGMYKLASVGELVWNDLNSNGIQDAGEPGVAGVQVNLYACSNNSSAILASTATDALGNYSFRDLLPGAYFLGFTAPQGYNFTLQDQGINDSLDSDVNQFEANTTCISLAVGQNDTTWDAGLVAVQPPLTVEKTSDSALIVPQTEINSTIKITNTGDTVLDSVSAVDRLPEEMSYVSDNRTGSVSGQNVTWSDLGSLDVGASTYIQLACKIDEGSSGTLTDLVNVTGTCSSGLVLNGSAESNLVIMAPAVEIRSSADQAEARLCSEVVCTLNVTNTGNFTLDPVKVVDALPAGMEFNHSQPEPSNIVRNSNGTTALTWENIGPMEPGANLKIHINSRLSEDATDTIENFAAAEATAPDGTVVRASGSVNVTTMPSLIEVSNDASTDAAEIGSNVTFTVKVTNLGSQALDPVRMIYTMPKGLDFVSTDSKQPYTAAKNPDGGWTIVWADIGSVPMQAGGSDVVNLVGSINDEATGTLATVSKVEGILPDGMMVDYCPMITGVKVKVPRIEVKKEASQSSGAPGSNISFIIKISNSGDVALNPVRAVDMLPSGLNYITDNRSGSVSGRNISWDNLGLMNPGDSTSILLIASIDKEASGTLENTVDAIGECSRGPVSSSSCLSVSVLIPGLKVEKTVGLPEPLQYGQFCDSKTVSGTGRVESAMAIRDSRLALAYNDAVAGEGDIDLSSVQAMSEKAGKLQRIVPTLNETNKSSLNFYDTSKIDFRGDTPLTGSKSIRSDSFFGGMGASIEESFQADQMEKDQAAYFGSTANATGAQVAGIDTNSSFNGTMEAAQDLHKMLEKDLKSHSRFSGKFELERNVKIHQNVTEKEPNKGCEGIDC
ncbi:MAG TPA: SdrD B-like domain-containing protein [Methanotrichaceae archaeon]|nr:SdrD B-like domain-containing protein [Methanotrichaceae archaeon]